MTESNSTAPSGARKPRQRKPKKPKKPRKDFPLTPHPCGLWCKKVRGKLHYFGSWRDDPKGDKAEALWEADAEDLKKGRVPKRRRTVVADGEHNLGHLIDEFLKTKRAKLAAGELSIHNCETYSRIC